MHELAARGFTCWLPDLPGQNDSTVGTDAVTLSDWRAAITGIVDTAGMSVVTAAWRAGALLDSQARPLARWRMAPASGAAIVRTLARARIAADKEAGRATSLDTLLDQMRGQVTEVAGNRLSPTMVTELEAATLSDHPNTRVVSVGAAAGALAGSPLWLRAEPGEDKAMAAAMAADIAEWANQCVSA
jgi:hypothetical protein